MNLYAHFFKRLLDMVGALFLIVLLLPVYLVCYVVIRVKMGAPVIFTQERPGKDERIFRLYKFRSMNSKTDERGNLLPDRERLTALGNFLRKTSLDEFPQFFNILKGDMSFVGPRPLLPRYLPWYTQPERVRHSVRPGITGWAQVNGRNTLTWDRRLAYDVDYVRSISFLLDVKIVWMTVKKVLSRSDIALSSGGCYLDDERRDKGLRPDERYPV